ncbi:hypothetical protein DTI35_05835 [Escherichia coli]|nr:hypothetical protein [Escherichia coli]
MSSECRTKAHINRNENRYGCLDNLRGHHDHSQKQHIRCFSVPRLPQIEVSENISGLAIKLTSN